VKSSLFERLQNCSNIVRTKCKPIRLIGRLIVRTTPLIRVNILQSAHHYCHNNSRIKNVYAYCLNSWSLAKQTFVDLTLNEFLTALQNMLKGHLNVYKYLFYSVYNFVHDLHIKGFKVSNITILKDISSKRHLDSLGHGQGRRRRQRQIH
jgi:hypothetical protein